MSRRRIAARRQAARRRRALQFVIGALVVLAAAIAWIVTGPPKPPSVSAARLEQQHSFGAADARVTIVEYGDFNCPSCQAYYQAGILERIQAEFPEDVRIVYRHFPVITAASPQLAQAAECAADQDAFWSFHNALFQRAPLRAQQAKEVAANLGLDQAQFDSCLDSRQYAGLIEAQTREAYNWGLTGTPSFVVNSRPLAGPPSYDQLESIIVAELSSQ